MDENEPIDPPRDASPPPSDAFPKTAESGQSGVMAMLRLWTLRGSAMRLAHPVLIIACLSVAWLGMWAAIDWAESLPNPQLLTAGAPLLAWYALAILALAALLRARSNPPPAFPAVLVLTVGLVPVPLLLAAIAPAYLTPPWLGAVTVAAVIYSLLYLARGLRTLTGAPQRVAAVAGVVFVAGFIWLTDALDVIPDVWAPAEIESAAEGAENQADAETLLFQQSARIDQALADVRAAASAKPQGYFLGFAGVGEQKVFAQEISLASRVLSERYGMDGRALTLLNDERDLEAAPLASVTGLKYALRGLAARMNVERDVLFLSISSHGAEDPAIAVSNSQLPLNDLTEQDLLDALSDSGIKWRVIIISACYAGGFIEPLKDPRTIVITAAAADRTSFGCSNDSDLTYFGEAFYRDALPGARSLREAFEKAKSAIAVRERHEHVDASKPQAFFGAEIESKLAAMGAPAP
jgi:Peptidase C13 family